MNQSLKYQAKTMATQLAQKSSNFQEKNIHQKIATIELCVQGFYKLFVQPYYGIRLIPSERNFIVSPIYKYNFNFPLIFAINNPSYFPVIVSQKLATLPISNGLTSYIAPFIVQNGIEIGRINGDKEFKIVYDIKVVEMDLANYIECDGYRRRRLV
ncbi:hypothetical protein P8452_22127 [Trifolium repens]|nr:hypothetical protein P8452_22127 [Trifolium repens]